MSENGSQPEILQAVIVAVMADGSISVGSVGEHPMPDPERCIALGTHLAEVGRVATLRAVVRGELQESEKRIQSFEVRRKLIDRGGN